MSPGCNKIVHWIEALAILTICSLVVPDRGYDIHVPAPYHPTSAGRWCWHGSTCAIPCSDRPAEDLQGSRQAKMAGLLLVDTCSCIYRCIQLSLPSSLSRGPELFALLGWTPRGLLQIMQCGPVPIQLGLYNRRGELSNTVPVPQSPAAVLHARGHTQSWAPDGNKFAACCLHESRLWLFDLCDITAWSPLIVDIQIHGWRKHSLAWAPSSERLLLCYGSGEVLICSTSGRCMRQTLQFHGLLAAVWSERGVAILTEGHLRLFTVLPGSQKLVLLHAVPLQPVSPVHSTVAAQLATAWDGTHVAALMASRRLDQGYESPDSCDVALVDWDSGSWRTYSLGIPGRLQGSTSLRWAPDGSCVLVGLGDTSIVMRLL